MNNEMKEADGDSKQKHHTCTHIDEEIAREKEDIKR
jgi:hypothetical protein